MSDIAERADEIERLRNERLWFERKVVGLEVEIERLQAALKQIGDFPYVGFAASQQMSVIARAALAKAEESK